MKYEKPEVTVLEQAITAIQNTVKSGPDIDTQPSVAAPAPDEHPAFDGVFDGVRYEILQEPAQ